MSARRGVLVFLLLLGLVGVVVLYAASQLSAPTRAASRPTVLTFDVPRDLDESEPPYLPLSFRGLSRRDELTLWDVVSAIRDAAEDDHVEALVLHIDDLRWGWAKIGEVRDAVQAFAESGKPVYVSLREGAGDSEYLLASAAGLVSMPPTASLGIDGLSVSVLFMRGTYDKLGISPNFQAVGRYKSAVESYTRTGMTPPAREALEAILDDHYHLLVDSLASARGLSRREVTALLDEGPFSARAARARGLVDTLLYDGEVDSLAVAHAGRRAVTLSLTRYIERQPSPTGGKRIALVVAEGEIVPGRSRESPYEGRLLGSETLIQALREARRRHSIRAIVLRVDSPGGAAQASDDIWREVERCRRVKPVIVSMSDYAASGGYYFAVAADSIVAQPATLTGSIGIFGGKLNLLGLYHKLGLEVESVTRGSHAGTYSPFRDFTPEEARRVQGLLEENYRGFIQRVAKGRARSEHWAESVAEGRVWTGVAARSRGLVDRLGGLEEAFDMARARADIGPDEEVVVERLPRPKRPFLGAFLQGLLSEETDETERLQDALPPALKALMAMARLPVGQALALLPYRIEVR